MVGNKTVWVKGGLRISRISILVLIFTCKYTSSQYTRANDVKYSDEPQEDTTSSGPVNIVIGYNHKVMKTPQIATGIITFPYIEAQPDTEIIENIKLEHTRTSVLLDNKPQCLQVISAGFGFTVNIKSCTLPKYCKHMTFTPIQTTWYGGTAAGLCTGISGLVSYVSTSTGHRLGNSYSDNWWQIIKVKFPKIQFHVGKHRVPMKPFFPDDQFVLLKHRNFHHYMFYPLQLISDYPMYDEETGFTYPKKPTSQDGRFCQVRYNSDRFSTLGAITSKDYLELFRIYKVPYQFTGDLPPAPPHLNHSHVNKFIYDIQFSYSIHEHQGVTSYLQSHSLSYSHFISCDPYKETVIYLPIQFSFFQHIISDLCVTIWGWLVTLYHSFLAMCEASLLTINQHYLFGEYFLLYVIFVVYFKDIYVPLVLLFLTYCLVGFSRHNV